MPGLQHALTQLERRIVQCQRCPELRAYTAEVARTRRRAYEHFTYWGKPVPGFGDGRAPIFIVGLAPGAHGANRTGRMFTGDRSGDFLYAALHRCGLANQAASTDRDDGLKLRSVYISAAARCAPPANKPTAAQLSSCRPYLQEELELLKPAVILCLGGIAWNAVLRVFRSMQIPVPRPQPKFTHGAGYVAGDQFVLGCYHVSQQNTFTGRLTPDMLDEVLQDALQRAESGGATVC